MNISENMERAIKDYGKEAFSDHKEETYAAIKAVCLCGEFLQNLEDWGRRRASPEIGWGNTEEVWKENFFKDYDNKLRVEEIRQLKEALDGGTLQVGEKIPLKNFLCQDYPDDGGSGRESVPGSVAGVYGNTDDGKPVRGLPGIFGGGLRSGAS